MLMAYSTAADVRRILNTKLTDPELEELIKEADALIDKRLGTQTSGDLLIRRLSTRLAAIPAKKRDPESFALGEYREDHDPIETWKGECKGVWRLCMKKKFHSSLEDEDSIFKLKNGYGPGINY